MYWWWRRAHALCGIIPLTIYLCVHFASGSSIFGGPAAFDRLLKLPTSPLLPVLEVLFILLPLLVHIAFGMGIWYTGSFNALTARTYRSWIFIMRRFAFLLLIPFLFYHVWMTRLRPSLVGVDMNAEFFHAFFAPLGMKIFYSAGIAVVLFYVTALIASECIAWGVTATRSSQRVVAWISWIATFVMTALGASIVFAF